MRTEVALLRSRDSRSPKQHPSLHSPNIPGFGEDVETFSLSNFSCRRPAKLKVELLREADCIVNRSLQQPIVEYSKSPRPQANAMMLSCLAMPERCSISQRPQQTQHSGLSTARFLKTTAASTWGLAHILMCGCPADASSP